MSSFNDQRLQAVAVVESLRGGVPTRASTKALPELRADLIDIFTSDLIDFMDGKVMPGRLVWGRYGQGKTHVLTTVEHLALDLGFAVSRVSLSREVSCHNLAHFYSRVATSLRTPNSTVFGLQRDLLDKRESELTDTLILSNNRYLHPLPALILKDFFKTDGEEQDLLYAYLMGDKFNLAEFKRIHRACCCAALPKFDTGFKVNEHIPAFFGVLADAVHFCGYQGLVILIDELELIGRLGKVSRMKAYHNLNWLLNWSRTMDYPIYTLGAAAINLQEEMWNPTDKNRVVESTVMPDLADKKYGATARLELINFFHQALSDDCPVIKPVTLDALVLLINELVKLHGLAYEWEAQLDVENLLTELGNQTVRTYIRATLQALDEIYLYHEESMPAVDEYVAATLDEEEQQVTEIDEEDDE